MASAARGARILGDRIWEARTRVALSVVHLDIGEVDRAERALEEARLVFEAEGQEFEAAQAVHDQGYVAYCRGDLPGALRLYDRAEKSIAGWGEVPVELGQDRCKALLAAGLPDEACSATVELLEREQIESVNRAELQRADKKPHHWSLQYLTIETGSAGFIHTGKFSASPASERHSLP